MDKHKYTLTVTEKQLQTINNALELFIRVGLGQLQEIYYQVVLRHIVARPGHEPDYEKIHKMLDVLAMELFGFETLGASWGMYSSELPNEFRRAYDIQQVVRNRLAVDRWEAKTEEQRTADRIGKWSVDFDPPHKTSTEDEMMPKIEHAPGVEQGGTGI